MQRRPLSPWWTADVRLHSLRLQNFRQHADTTLRFERGLTGIIGPNGAGKSTLLEAIAFALYGTPAARGTRESIRFARAPQRAPVRVELVFELAGHRYRVLRGLSAAEVYLDDGDTPIASTLSGATELLQRRLGMTRSEFFHTYFTGQKELDVMAALGPADRARFLSRVLGYDRISVAQEFARERRRVLLAESNGLKQGMPDADAIWRAVADAEARVATTRERVAECERTRDASAAKLAELEPTWLAAQQWREEHQQVLSDFRLAESEAQALTRDLERLDRDLEAVATAHAALASVRAQLDASAHVGAALAEQERLSDAESRRLALLERVQALAANEAALAERAQRLESAPVLERETQEQLHTLRTQLQDVEQHLERERTGWARDRQEAETRLEALRRQYTELSEQRDKLEGLGADSPCPTCGRPLGATYRSVLDQLHEQIETVRVDGNYYRQRSEQLSSTPSVVEETEAKRRQVQQDLQAAEKRLGRIQGAMGEAVDNARQREQVTAQLELARTALAALPSGFNAAQLAALREETARRQVLEREAARLGALVDRELVTRTERTRVVAQRELARTRLLELEARQARAGMDDAAYLGLREAFERATAAARRAEFEALAAQGDAERARAALDSAEQGRRDLARLQETLDRIDGERRLHEELDRAFTDVRTDLNFQLRPELADVASDFLADLTDGRYPKLELDEEYRVVVREDGEPKPVLSGGEEDLCNLVLRLAISQMIAERAGQHFSLLILDEVFGSLDEMRRANVMELLRKLHDRFEQVIVITHIEQVREGLDRLIQVRYDDATGSSLVTSDALSVAVG